MWNKMLPMACLLAASAAPCAEIDDLSWMSGTWKRTAGDEWSIEQWSDTTGGVLLATSKSGTGNRLQSFEFLRISPEDNGDLVYWASPNGSAPVPFRLVEASGNSVRFENTDHDFPQVISYDRQGDEMEASIAGEGGESAMRWRWQKQ